MKKKKEQMQALTSRKGEKKKTTAVRDLSLLYPQSLEKEAATGGAR